MSANVISIISLVVSALALVVAGVSVRYTAISARSDAASAAIDAARRKDERAPEFDFRFDKHPTSGFAYLVTRLRSGEPVDLTELEIRNREDYSLNWNSEYTWRAEVRRNLTAGDEVRFEVAMRNGGGDGTLVLNVRSWIGDEGWTRVADVPGAPTRIGDVW